MTRWVYITDFTRRGATGQRAAAVAVLVAILVPTTGTAQSANCDPDLPSSRTHPYGYRQRGDRCEGVYIQEVALATLLVASLTESYEDFDPGRGQDLQLEWTAAPADVHIRAHGIGPQLYYRMDTARAAGTTSYRWPVGLLAALEIGKPKLGVVAWTEQRVGEGARRVYLPLRVREQQQQRRSRDGYELLLVAGRELKEVYVHLAGVRDDGTSLPAVLAGKPLGRGYYPARRAIPIQLPRPAAPGVYEVELVAELPGREIVTTSIYLRHTG